MKPFSRVPSFFRQFVPGYFNAHLRHSSAKYHLDQSCSQQLQANPSSFCAISRGCGKALPSVPSMWHSPAGDAWLGERGPGRRCGMPTDDSRGPPPRRGSTTPGGSPSRLRSAPVPQARILTATRGTARGAPAARPLVRWLCRRSDELSLTSCRLSRERRWRGRRCIVARVATEGAGGSTALRLLWGHRVKREKIRQGG